MRCYGFEVSKVLGGFGCSALGLKGRIVCGSRVFEVKGWLEVLRLLVYGFGFGMSG